MITEKPGVSIVIPTFNRATDLLRALASIQAQTYSNWEAIVIDNYSCDNTDDVIAGLNDPRILLFKKKNYGIIAASRNLGIQNAKADYIAFLDSDDWWSPEKLKKSLDALYGGCDLVYHDLWIVDQGDKKKFVKKIGTRPLQKPVFSDLILNGNAIANSSVVVRTELLQAINGISEDPSLVTTEDYDCWLRLSKVTDRFECLPEILGYYWQGNNNNSGNAEVMYQVLKALDTLYFNPFIASQNIEMPSWIIYKNARSAYLLRKKKEAVGLLKILLKRKLQWKLKKKVFFMYTNLQFLPDNFFV